jgi:hypothetical protein
MRPFRGWRVSCFCRRHVERRRTGGWLVKIRAPEQHLEKLGVHPVVEFLLRLGYFFGRHGVEHSLVFLLDPSPLI